MDTSTIGETAGMVWQFLSTHGKTPLRTLEKEIAVTPIALAMAIGWLAREGKLQVVQEKRTLMVCLSDSE
jgi:hypothetical protein